MTRLRLLLDCREPLGRGGYFFAGVLLCALKYNIDRFLIWRMSGQRWSLLDHTRVGEYLWPRLPVFNDIGSFVTMLGISLPFMGLGIVLTLRRLRTIPLSPWLALIFFVPVIKFIFFALLCLLPSQETRLKENFAEGGLKAWFGVFIPRSGWAAALTGIIMAVAGAAVCVWLGTTVYRNYGWALFVGIPCALGFFSVLVFGYHEARSFKSCMLVSTLVVVAAGLGLMLVAIEGFICLIMAAPLAVPMSMMGGVIAWQIQRRDWWQGRSFPNLLCRRAGSGNDGSGTLSTTSVATFIRDKFPGGGSPAGKSLAQCRDVFRTGAAS